MTTTPAAITDARAAAEAVRALNYSSKELNLPGDAYDVIGALADLVLRLPQAITQTERRVSELDTSGKLRSTADSVEDDLSAMRVAVIDAVKAARDLHTAIDQVQQALSHLGYRDDEEEEQ